MAKWSLCPCIFFSDGFRRIPPSSISHNKDSPDNDGITAAISAQQTQPNLEYILFTMFLIVNKHTGDELFYFNTRQI